MEKQNGMANRNLTVQIRDSNQTVVETHRLEPHERQGVRDQLAELLDSLDKLLNWQKNIQPTLDAAKAQIGAQYWVPSTLEAFDYFLNVFPPHAMGVFGVGICPAADE
jgi:hypothetical protein